jgi:hypothetical protein
MRADVNIHVHTLYRRLLIVKCSKWTVLSTLIIWFFGSQYHELIPNGSTQFNGVMLITMLEALEILTDACLALLLVSIPSLAEVTILRIAKNILLSVRVAVFRELKIPLRRVLPAF